MRALVLAMLLAAPAAAEEVLSVPSGQPVTLLERLEDDNGPAGRTLRYRFVAPMIARVTGSISVEQALQDVEALCGGFVLTDLAEAGAAPDQVVITLMDRPVEFGVATPEATQYFEAFRVEAGVCVWDSF